MGDAIQTGTVYVRDAVPDDFDPITRLLTRAFLHDPLIHWFGSFSAPIPMPGSQEIWGERSTKLPKDIELIYHVRYAFLVSVYLDHGHIIVCVRRETDNAEKILSIAAWLPHRNRCDGTSAVRKFKLFLKVIFGTWRRPGGWGLSGLKVHKILVLVFRVAQLVFLQRIFFQALPAMDELFLDASKITGLLPEEIWTLSNVATDPNESGKGERSGRLRTVSCGKVDLTVICVCSLQATARWYWNMASSE